MNPTAARLRSPIPVLFALCASVGSAACGAAPPDAPPLEVTTSNDGGGTSFDASVDAGVIVPPDASGLDAGPSDGSMSDTTTVDGAPETGSPETGTPEGGSPEGGGPVTCAPGTADCDHDPSNGCEVTLSSDPKNCNACGHDCTALANVSGPGVTCNAGVCDVPPSACTAGYAHCSSNPNDGCEANLTSPQTCGSCTTQCSGSTPDCSGGACTDGCTPATLSSCSGTCVDTTSSSANCGACGNACPVPANGSATCAMSTCTSSCNSGFHTCDNGATCSSNGVAATCGTSCTPCPVTDGATMATCSAQGVCGVVCDSMHHSCDNGATCSSNSAVATCGSSCTPCPVPPNTTGASCNGSSCGYVSCTAGFADCNGDPADGCEVNLETDGLACGACGHSCLGGSCSGGACQPVTLAVASNAFDLTLDSDNVYFTYGDLVGSIPKTGGTLASSQSIASGVGSIVDIGATLYALSGSDAIVDGNTHVSGETFANAGTSGTDSSAPLVAAEGLPFWVNYDSGTIVARYFTPIPSPRAYILTAYTPPAGAKVETLAAAPDGYLVWDEYASGGTRRMLGGFPSCGGSPAACSVTVATTAPITGTSAPSLFADATFVYYFDNDTLTTLTRAGALVSTASITVTNPSLPVVVGTTVYFAATGGICSVPAAGGPTTVLVPGAYPNDMTADAVSLYWTDYEHGKVMMLAF